MAYFFNHKNEHVHAKASYIKKTLLYLVTLQRKNIYILSVWTSKKHCLLGINL